MKSLRLTYLTLSLAFFAAACSESSSSDGTSPDTRPAYVSLDMQTNFRNDQVRLTLDGKQIFDGRVTTDYSLSLASRIAFETVGGMHRLQAEITNSGIRRDLMIIIRDTMTVRLVYDPSGNGLSISTVPYLINYR